VVFTHQELLDAEELLAVALQLAVLQLVEEVSTFILYAF